MRGVIAFQGVIAATGTAQNLPNNPVWNRITITAKSGNTASIEIGNASTVTTGNGYILAAGQSVVIVLNNGNTNQLWVVGTLADVYSVIGS